MTTVAVVLAAGLGLTGCASDNAATDAASSVGAGASSAASTVSSSAAASAGTYTMAQVQEHNTDSSCWAVVDGQVYDVTSWIKQHPGGPDKIKGLCGTDATEQFRGQHDSDAKPNNRLESFKIGTLQG